MKRFYIETELLTKFNRNLRYIYTEDEQGKINFEKIIDPVNGDEISISALKGKTESSFLLSIQTAYKGNYKRTYLD